MRSNLEPDRSALRFAALVVVGLAMLFFGLGDRPLWDTDEGMHAATSKTMVETGDWLHPMLNGEPFYDKPPMFNWLVALSFVALGFTEFAARLPAAIAGLATVLVTYGYGRHAVGSQAAFLGAIVLATSLEFVVLSRVVVHDILLAFGVTTACLAFFAAYAGERRRTTHLIVMYAATGLAVLAKGPVGALLSGGAVLTFLVLRRDPRFIRKMMLVRGTLLVAVVGLPPYLLMAARDPDFARYFVVVQNVGSFVSAESRHPEPFYFYLPILIAGLFPWIAFLPAAVRVSRRPDDIPGGRAFLWAWFGFVVLFFSAAVSKLATYVLPAFPAAALLIGVVWDRRLASAASAPRRGFLLACGLAGAVAGALAWFAWTEAPRHALYDAAAHRPYLVAFTAYLAGITFVGAIFAWRRMDRALFVTIATIVAGLVLFLTVVVGPVVDLYRSSKAVAAWIDPRLEPGEPIWFYPRLRDSTLFYTDRGAAEFDRPEEIARYLERPGAMCVVQTETLSALDSFRDRFRVVFTYGNKSVIESTAAAPRPAP